MTPHKTEGGPAATQSLLREKINQNDWQKQSNYSLTVNRSSRPVRYLRWKIEEDTAPWYIIEDTPEARAKAIKAGAMFFTNCSFDKLPMYSADERADLFNNAVMRFGDLHFDFDAADPTNALKDLQTLLFERLPQYGVDPGQVEIHFSGAKGFHARISDTLIGAQNGDRLLPRIYKRMALTLARGLRTFDQSIYNMGYGRQFRIPNVKRRNGKYKIPLTSHEVDPDFGFTLDMIRVLADNPRIIPELPVHAEPAKAMEKLFRQFQAEVRRELIQSNQVFLTEDQEEELKRELPACMRAVLAMEDYHGLDNINFNKLCYAILVPYFRVAGMSKDMALEVAGGFLAGFHGSETYATVESRFEHFETAWTAAAKYKWNCGITASLLDCRKLCNGCPVRTKDVFPDDLEQTGRKARGFRLVSAAELLADPSPVDWLIEGVVEKGSLAALIGQTGTMKTFLALAWSVAVASGRSWAGHDVPASGPVIYIAGEGHRGIPRRLATLGQHLEVDISGLPLFVSSAACGFLDASSAEVVANAVDVVANEHGSPRLIVIDTMARCFGPGDENSASDVSQFINRVSDLAERYGSAILIVHHSGHSDSTRGRGSSAFRAALDAEFILTKSRSGVHTLEQSKAKDTEEMQNMGLRALPVSTGWVDPEGGMPIFSVVLETCDVVLEVKPLTGANKIVMDALVEFGKPVDIKKWQAAAFDKGLSPGAMPKSRITAFNRAVTALQTSGHVLAESGLFRVGDMAT